MNGRDAEIHALPECYRNLVRAIVEKYGGTEVKRDFIDLILDVANGREVEFDEDAAQKRKSEEAILRHFIGLMDALENLRELRGKIGQ